MKRGLLIIFALILPFFYPSKIRAEEIQQFDAAITINADGTIAVSESVHYDFGNADRHGVFRTIPFIKTNESGKKFKLDFSEVSVTDDKQNPYQFSTTYENNLIKLKVGDPNKTISGAHTYNISYVVRGALTYFPDHDELYWNVTGNDWPVTITSASAHVALPKSVTQQDIRGACYTGTQGSTASNCRFTTTQGKASIETIEPLQAGEGLTTVIGFPKGNVAILEPQPYTPFWETPFGNFLKTILLGTGILAGVFWYLVYPLSLPFKWWKYGRDPRPPMGEAKAWFDAPKTKDRRSLTPGETGAFIDERVDLDDICATIVDLARRGYMKIIETKKNDFTFTKQKEFADDTTLVDHEKLLLDGIFEDEDSVSVKDLKLSDTVEKVRKTLYENLVTEGFFPKNPQKIRSFYEIIRFFSLATLNIPLFLSSLIFGTNMPQKTIFGSQQAAVARSLRNFLITQEKKLTYQARNQMMFEKLLPYAIAFNVERIWAKRFETITMHPIDWYVSSTSSEYLNSSAFVHSLNSSLSRVRSSATPPSSTSGFSSGFSGGSSGGGGGGGGGGSW